ncbi:MAG: sulfatase [Proteobacteria bacterium]|nr:sulfatase [Pseudomonadota bacterium]
MKAIMVMFDSLNRHMLPPYGCDWVKAPNFMRLAEKSVVFDNCYAGSLPCMPARREIHTGRYNFLHRSWGPIEPFDRSMPEILKENGVHSHLASDHLHYWEDGGCTYHTRYSTWGISRGQEGDPWKGVVKDPEIPDHVPNMRKFLGTSWRQDWINREYMRKEEDQPQFKTFQQGIEFIETNRKEDNWFLQIETFDPHEPFFTQQKYKDLYDHEYDGPHFDWPNYNVVKETPAQVEHLRWEYAALLSMCDNYLGKVLDLMDEHDLWRDTMLIINTDHGFLLGEHDWWAKMVQPIYNEIAQTPLFVWDPRSGVKNQRRQSLVQTIDLAPTLLDFFGIEAPAEMQGKPLAETIVSDQAIRKAGLFGITGAHVNVTDGRYIYMRAPLSPDNKPLFDYTLMPTHMTALFRVDELQEIELAGPFSFTRGCRTMKIETRAMINPFIYGSLLFDLENDPEQEKPIIDFEVEKRMIKLMVDLMKENDAPVEQYVRLGLPCNGVAADEHLALKGRTVASADRIGNTEVVWCGKGKSAYYSMLSLVPKPMKRQFVMGAEGIINDRKLHELDEDKILELFMELAPPINKGMAIFIVSIIKEKGKEYPET